MKVVGCLEQYLEFLTTKKNEHNQMFKTWLIDLKYQNILTEFLETQIWKRYEIRMFNDEHTIFDADKEIAHTQFTSF